VASLKADENTILPDRFRQKDHERGISPEATPMTKGGSLAVSGVESTRENVSVTAVGNAGAADSRERVAPQMTTYYQSRRF
jgi:hypothetical protein